MRKAYQFRLNPSHHQRTLLLKTLDACRWVYNETLAIRKNTWEQEKKTLSLYETNKLLTGWKVEKPELIDVHSQVLQNVQARVDLAFQAFYRRVKAGQTPGYPRFRGRGRCDSITFKQSGFSICEDKLVLSKIGAVKIVLHRPMEGQIKTLTVRRDRVGNWYACFACEVPEHPLSMCESVVGVDVGIEWRESWQSAFLPERRASTGKSTAAHVEGRKRDTRTRQTAKRGGSYSPTDCQPAQGLFPPIVAAVGE